MQQRRHVVIFFYYYLVFQLWCINTTALKSPLKSKIPPFRVTRGDTRQQHINVDSRQTLYPIRYFITRHHNRHKGWQYLQPVLQYRMRRVDNDDGDSNRESIQHNKPEENDLYTTTETTEIYNTESVGASLNSFTENIHYPLHISRCKTDNTVPKPVLLGERVKMYGVKRKLNHNEPNNDNRSRDMRDERKNRGTNQVTWSEFTQYSDLCRLEIDSVFMNHDLLVNDCKSTKRSTLMQFIEVESNQVDKSTTLIRGERPLKSSSVVLVKRPNCGRYLYNASPLFGQIYTIRLEKYKHDGDAVQSDSTKFILHKYYTNSFNIDSRDPIIHYGDTFNLYPYKENKNTHCLEDESQCVDRVRCGGASNKILDVIHLNQRCCSRTYHDNRCGKGPLSSPYGFSILPSQGSMHSVCTPINTHEYRVKL